jgi:hypothetical protein
MGENRPPPQFNDIPFDFGAVGEARPLEVREALTACAWILADENHESGPPANHRPRAGPTLTGRCGSASLRRGGARAFVPSTTS